MDRKENSADSVAGASNMAASDQKKGPSASVLIKKAGEAVKKIFRSDEQREHFDYDEEVKVILSNKENLSNRLVPRLSYA